MRSFPVVVVAGIFLCLAPALAAAQKLNCYPCGHPFGKVQIGNSLSFNIRLTNTGSNTLRITSKSMQGPEFSFGAFPIPTRIQPGASVQLPVIFAPTVKGYVDGKIT